ncbi:MAG: hypothetical protein H6734_23950 [Alphaproteobacteria bacterium]|nr:hypothetical protein [Alphaproteobacteria bacterium]
MSDTAGPVYGDGCWTSRGCWGASGPYGCGSLQELLEGPARSVTCHVSDGRGYFHVRADCGLPEAWQEFWFTTDTEELVGALWISDMAMSEPSCCPVQGGGLAPALNSWSGWIPP